MTVVVASWRVDLLDAEDRPLGVLGTVVGGSFTVDATTRQGGNASLVMDEPDLPVDWLKHRIRINYVRDGVVVPKFTGLLTSPKTSHGPFGVRYEVDVATKVSILDEMTVGAWFALPAGEPIIPAVVSLIESAGVTRSQIAATDSDAVLANPITFEPDTPLLTVVNKLLDAAGYWGLKCDESGLFRVEPYTKPRARPVAHRFVTGEANLRAPEYTRTQDHSRVPNRFIVTGQGDETAAALVGVAKNENPESKYSFQARGRWVDGTEEGFEAADQAVLDQRAARRLLDAMTPVAKLEVSHAVNDLAPNDLVEFQGNDGGIVYATVQSMTVDLVFDAQVAAVWREVTDID